jgi:hypothetical protein
MKRLGCSTGIVLALAAVASNWETPGGALSAAVQDEHAYFDSLTRRADLWKQYSMRDAAQLADTNKGGFGEGTGTFASGVTYNPGADDDRHRQDAARVTIPAWQADTPLTQGISSGDTTLYLAAYKPSYPAGRVIRIDNEVMTVTRWLNDTSITVQRGSYSTAPASHAAGAMISRNSNSLRPQVRFPLVTEDGHSYFFTWDGYWTDSYVGAGAFNHKAFQFSSGGSKDGDNLFLEPDVSYNSTNATCWKPGNVGSFLVRSYNTTGGVANWLLSNGNQLGPSATAQQPLGPRAAFCFNPNQWVRFFLNIRQRANDYDYVDMWVADETRDPVQVLFNVPISVPPGGKFPNSIQKFWLEFNTSTDDYLRLDNRPLVSYVRNFVALRDNDDPRNLLVRPVPGAQAVEGPAAPRNVRIIQGS